jgi:hypothetical protein
MNDDPAPLLLRVLVVFAGYCIAFLMGRSWGRQEGRSEHDRTGHVD